MCTSDKCPEKHDLKIDNIRGNTIEEEDDDNEEEEDQGEYEYDDDEEEPEDDPDVQDINWF